MFDDIDRAYYQRRALEEREKAASTENILTRRIREELAEAYERKLEALSHSSTEAAQ